MAKKKKKKLQNSLNPPQNLPTNDGNIFDFEENENIDEEGMGDGGERLKEKETKKPIAKSEDKKMKKVFSSIYSDYEGRSTKKTKTGFSLGEADLPPLIKEERGQKEIKSKKKEKGEVKTKKREGDDGALEPNAEEIGTDRDLLIDFAASEKRRTDTMLKILGGLAVFLVVFFGVIYYMFLGLSGKASNPDENNEEKNEALSSVFRQIEAEENRESERGDFSQTTGGLLPVARNTASTEAPAIDENGEVDADVEKQNENKKTEHEREQKELENMVLKEQLDLSFDKKLLRSKDFFSLEQDLHNFTTTNIKEGEMFQLMLRVGEQEPSLLQLSNFLNLRLPEEGFQNSKYALVLIREDGFSKFGLLIKNQKGFEENKQLMDGYEERMVSGIKVFFFNEPLFDPKIENGFSFNESNKFKNAKFINLSERKSYYLNYAVSEDKIVISTSNLLMTKLIDN